jgi:hypothetical protein
VIACYYCNSIKRRFDPSRGQLTRVVSRESQLRLIESARLEIRRRKDEGWRYGGGLRSSCEFMVRHLVLDLDVLADEEVGLFEPMTLEKDERHLGTWRESARFGLTVASGPWE